MPRDISTGTFGGMLDDLKSRLGFNRNDERYPEDDYDDARFDEFDEYDDYDGYAESYDAPVEGDGYRRSQGAASRLPRYGRPDSSPSLVTINDVKATTPMPDMDETGFGSTRVGGHYVIDATAPAPSSPAYRAAQKEAEARSEGLNSLFEPSPTTAEAAIATPEDPTERSGAASYDPYIAYSSAAPSTHAPSRKLTVIKPVIYGDVEQVARSVKSGDVVVLAMSKTPDDLSKRILDFSFGVASALDASVECPGDKVFAIARGTALTESEKRRLRAQSVL